MPTPSFQLFTSNPWQPFLNLSHLLTQVRPDIVLALTSWYSQNLAVNQHLHGPLCGPVHHHVWPGLFQQPCWIYSRQSSQIPLTHNSVYGIPLLKTFLWLPFSLRGRPGFSPRHPALAASLPFSSQLTSCHSPPCSPSSSHTGLLASPGSCHVAPASGSLQWLSQTPAWLAPSPFPSLCSIQPSHLI